MSAHQRRGLPPPRRYYNVSVRKRGILRPWRRVGTSAHPPQKEAGSFPRVAGLPLLETGVQRRRPGPAL